MSRQLCELENIFGQLIEEHRRLLHHVTAQQTAMQVFYLKAMEQAGKAQEGSRLRIATLENKRRAIVMALAGQHKLEGKPTVAQLAELDPQGKSSLLQLRSQLKGLMTDIAGKAHIAGRLAGAVLGHLNTAVRLLAGAIEQAGLYTKEGVPCVTARIGVMEAVG
jgi:hypothetical protein